eukprot:CAMPEP_0198311026 /NCGR_PEP_ID=MMETSP1450-20131203/2886_1 /TAXON_ID=753684 ORGANISM="Madagascaria erythrocladiodes, Strain CCMP3234" /NCGR_SAMPLE_ID=MMETSP1450 /ASSEMBLY_ACC=CAM_ASM_001115 /LENGTH=265 /DNA_ID=CAMNT_0044013881 /DNA_START=43 /DNA_END=837 /DNA_ORIENTATION=+
MLGTLVLVGVAALAATAASPAAAQLADDMLPPSFVRRIKDFAEADAKGLLGMKYNETVPRFDDSLVGKRVLFAVAHCFEHPELTVAAATFLRAGANVTVAAPGWIIGETGGVVASCHYARAFSWFTAHMSFEQALEHSWDAVVVPGGQWSSGVVRSDPHAQQIFRRQVSTQGALMAPVCSGSTVLIDIGESSGRKLTGSPANRVDLINSGALYQDEAVVYNDADQVLTGRSPQNHDTQLFTLAIAAWLAGRPPLAALPAAHVRAP